MWQAVRPKTGCHTVCSLPLPNKPRREGLWPPSQGSRATKGTMKAEASVRIVQALVNFQSSLASHSQGAHRLGRVATCPGAGAKARFQVVPLSCPACLCFSTLRLAKCVPLPRVGSKASLSAPSMSRHLGFKMLLCY